jgi:hypothetical protein
MKLKQLLMEDARNDIQSRLQRMPLWKKYEMSFDIPGWVQPNKMKIGTTKDGRKTYSIAISVANAPKYDWQQMKSVKLIQKYFPEYEVVGRHGTLGGVKGDNPGERTYTFISNKVGESTTQAVSEASPVDLKAKKPEVIAKLKRMPVWNKYNMAIEKLAVVTARKSGLQKYVLNVSLEAPDYPGAEYKKATNDISKAIKKAFPELDVYEFGVFSFVKVNGKNTKPIKTFELETPGYSARNVK